MGMDVYGNKPINKTGEYFRASVWTWRPLWEFCNENFLVANKVDAGQFNNGDGLNAKDAEVLARQLREALANGSVQNYIDERNEYLANLERPTCEWCAGTGIRTDEVGTQMGMPERELDSEMASLTGRTKGWCNGCSGEGKTEHWDTNYQLHLETVKHFAEFIENSGGFRIC